MRLKLFILLLLPFCAGSQIKIVHSKHDPALLAYHDSLEDYYSYVYTKLRVQKFFPFYTDKQYLDSVSNSAIAPLAAGVPSPKVGHKEVVNGQVKELVYKRNIPSEWRDTIANGRRAVVRDNITHSTYLDVHQKPILMVGYVPLHHLPKRTPHKQSPHKTETGKDFIVEYWHRDKIDSSKLLGHIK